jgi:hypothetical protein
MSRLLITIVVFFVTPVLSGAGPAAGEDLFIAFKGETFSAHVEESQLKAVTEKIENETGVWFKAGEALLEERVSVVFDELPFEDGLERILSKMSYSLVFDDDDEVVGVFLFRSVDSRQKQVIRRAQARSRTRVAPRPVPRRRTIPTRRPQPFRN